MSSVEDLLSRTLRDPARALPVPADPVPAIRRRAHRQRRNAALGVAVVLLLAAATLLAPSALGRFTRPAPVATDPAPPGSGLLEWPVSGPLAGDAKLVRDAAERWRRGSDGPTRLLWAGRVGADRVVVLQALDADGRPTVAEVAGRGGTLRLLAVDPILDPGTVVLRLVDPAAGTSDRTLLLPRPGAASVTQLIGNGVANPVPSGGVVVLDGDQGGEPVAVLDRDSRVLGDGLVPPPDRLPVTPDVVRLITPVWDRGGVRLPRPNDYAAGHLLGTTIDPRETAPVGVGVIEDIGALDLPSHQQAEPRFYEVHRAGRTYLGWIVWVGDTPYCAHLDDVTDTGGQPDAIVLRCALPQEHTGLLYVLLHNGIQATGLRLDAARPGERTVAPRWPTPVRERFLTLFPDFPTGPGLLRLEDHAGLTRPSIRLPAYHP
jgi:hypothetical protein